MSKLTLNVTKAEFENRVVNVIETAMGSPLVKKRTNVLNNAMVTLLHGKREDGKHEHNLDLFWSDEQVTAATVSTWVATENYHHEDNYDDDSSTFTCDSEDAAKRQLYSNVCGYIAESVPYIIHLPSLMEKLHDAGSDYGVRFLEDIDKKAEDCDEFDTAEFLESICNEDLETHEVAFNYITNLICIEGTHSITEVAVEVPTTPKQQEPIVVEPTSITIHTIIETHKAEGEDSNSVDISTSSTINAEKHDQELLELFRNHVNEESGLDFDGLIDHHCTQDVIIDMDADEEDIRAMSYDEVVDWLCENGRPNMLTDIIPDATYGLVHIDVRYENETM